jgi:hypothetical protein
MACENNCVHNGYTTGIYDANQDRCICSVTDEVLHNNNVPNSL